MVVSCASHLGTVVALARPKSGLLDSSRRPEKRVSQSGTLQSVDPPSNPLLRLYTACHLLGRSQRKGPEGGPKDKNPFAQATLGLAKKGASLAGTVHWGALHQHCGACRLARSQAALQPHVFNLGHKNMHHYVFEGVHMFTWSLHDVHGPIILGNDQPLLKGQKETPGTCSPPSRLLFRASAARFHLPPRSTFRSALERT